MMGMPVTMRPGVYTEVQAYPMHSADRQRFAAAVGVAGAQSPTEVQLISTPAQAQAFGVGSALHGMLLAMLEGERAPVYAVAAGSDYAAAFAQLEGLPIYAVATDGGEQPLHAYLGRCVAAGSEQIGLLAVGGAAAAIEAAGRCNDAHLVVVCDGGQSCHLTAAAFASAMRAGAAGSLAGLAVRSVEGFDGALSAAEIEGLLVGGVTPFERVGGQVCSVRARTSRTRNDEGVADNTFSDLSATLTADAVIDAVRRAVRLRLKGLKNNAEAREGIASQIVVELEQKRLEGLIDSYRPPIVRAAAQDPAACVAEIRFQIAPEISQIVLSAQIVI